MQEFVTLLNSMQPAVADSFLWLLGCIIFFVLLAITIIVAFVCMTLMEAIESKKYKIDKYTASMELLEEYLDVSERKKKK